MGVARGGGSLAGSLVTTTLRALTRFAIWASCHSPGLRCYAPMLGMFLYTQLGGASNNGAWVFAVAAFVSGYQGSA